MNSWMIPALLSALFAALTAILAKIGISGISSNLATAIRTTVILIFAWGIVIFQGLIPQMQKIDQKSYIFLILSGLATGLSWLFYFRALQLGDASKVVPIDKLSLVLTIVFATIFLKEHISALGLLGIGLITIGTILVTFR